MLWNASTDNVGVEGYHVERCQGTTSACTAADFVRIGNATAAQYYDAGLASQTTYSYRVRAFDASNNTSDFTQPQSATTLDPSIESLITYRYDEVASANGNGRLTSVTDPTGTTRFSYDQRGNVTEVVKGIESSTYTINREYDSLGRLKTLTYPMVAGETARETVSYGYDDAGNLKSVGSYLTDITYNALGQPRRITFGNNTVTSYDYYPDSFDLKQIATEGPPTPPGGSRPVLQNLGYFYDDVGNVVGIGDGVIASNGQSFEYDDLDRLTAAAGPYGTATYAYDPVGNLTCNSQLKASVLPCSNDPAKSHYAYPAGGPNAIQPHAVRQVTKDSGVDDYYYDNNGNLLSGAERTFVYDADDRPVSITRNGATTAMAYDFTGERVIKLAGSIKTYYVTSLIEDYGGYQYKYIFAGSTRIAMKGSDGSVLYLHGNHLGSLHLATDAAGIAKEQIQYQPFGATFNDVGDVSIAHKYTAQEFDLETNLYYYGARYYDQELGRFISPDSIGFSLGDPQTGNRYSYVINRPLRYTDPSGLAHENGPGAPGNVCGRDCDYDGAWYKWEWVSCGVNCESLEPKLICEIALACSGERPSDPGFAMLRDAAIFDQQMQDAVLNFNRSQDRYSARFVPGYGLIITERPVADTCGRPCQVRNAFRSVDYAGALEAGLDIGLSALEIGVGLGTLYGVAVYVPPNPWITPVGLAAGVFMLEHGALNLGLAAKDLDIALRGGNEPPAALQDLGLKGAVLNEGLGVLSGGKAVIIGPNRIDRLTGTLELLRSGKSLTDIIESQNPQNK